MNGGIYCYIDKKDNSIIYIGKDSYINENRRHYAHTIKCNYDRQVINRVLQNDIERYEYRILEKNISSSKILNALEMSFIQKYNPKFNFTKGGDGLLGHHRSIETRRKISNSNKGNTNWLGKKHSEETKKKMSDNHKKYWLGKNHSEESMEKMSRKKNTTGYFRVIKAKNKKLLQGFNYCYRYYDEEKKRKRLYSTSIQGLKEKVEKRGLIWKKL